MRFEFATATRIIFGEGAVHSLPELAQTFGKRPLVVTGTSKKRTAALVSALAAPTFAVPGEPTIDLIREGARQVRDGKFDVVVSIGGGSVIDAGKAIAVIATNGGEPLAFLEVIGKGAAIIAQALPFIAVPTTAGTGSEVTRNAVLGSPEHRVKASLRSPLMLPKVALIDPELTYGLPPEITAYTGLDALTQLIEPFVSSRANPLADALCLDGIPRVARSLRLAYQVGADKDARCDMALASLYGGLALANAGLGIVHGFAAPLGGGWKAPHGALCAALLPHAMATNLAALRNRMQNHPALERYREVARLLTGRNDASADEGVEWVKLLCIKLRIPPLSAWGINKADLPDLAEKAARASSTQANPLSLMHEELVALASAAL